MFYFHLLFRWCLQKKSFAAAQGRTLPKAYRGELLRPALQNHALSHVSHAIVISSLHSTAHSSTVANRSAWKTCLAIATPPRGFLDRLAGLERQGFASTPFEHFVQSKRENEQRFLVWKCLEHFHGLHCIAGNCTNVHLRVKCSDWDRSVPSDTSWNHLNDLKILRSMLSQVSSVDPLLPTVARPKAEVVDGGNDVELGKTLELFWAAAQRRFGYQRCAFWTFSLLFPPVPRFIQHVFRFALMERCFP